MAAAILESLQSGTAEPAGEAGVPAALAAEGADLPAGAQPLATIERTRARFLVQRVRLSLVGREGAPLASLHAGGIELTAHRDVAGQGAHFRLDELYVDDRTAAVATAPCLLAASLLSAAPMPARLALLSAAFSLCCPPTLSLSLLSPAFSPHGSPLPQSHVSSGSSPLAAGGVEPIASLCRGRSGGVLASAAAVPALGGGGGR